MKPYAESCEQNKQAILAVLQEEFADARRVLEIGSGTGQHAVHFARHLPQLLWQTSELAENHPGIHAWLADAQLDNVLAPLALDVAQASWPEEKFDGVFSANTAHIMHWPQVQAMFAGVGKILCAAGCFCLYGPFNIDGQYTADSNARFDGWLQQRDPGSGIRDIAELDRLAQRAGLTRAAQHTMPADNFILVWRASS